MMTYLVATRSKGKLREIRKILSRHSGIHLVDLEEASLAASPEEDGIEIFETFAENAVAKARYFQHLTGLATIADDSGLVVDALEGLPGVRSRRFAPGTAGLLPEEVDEANNRHLAECLVGVSPEARTARYVCAAALDLGVGEPLVFHGAAHGRILDTPRGHGGFGYDPFFLDPSDDRTFAELAPQEKDARSHRGAAFRALGEYLTSEATRPR